MTDGRPSQTPDSALPDSVRGGFVERLPAPLRPYARLARWDRPAGAWLLILPGFIGVALAMTGRDWGWAPVLLILLLAVGGFVMRSAGCAWNDIADRDLDRRVARTANRPVASGAISVGAALAFTIGLCLVGLIVLLLLPPLAQIVSLCAIPLVAAYPFMKRITWWPQAWLGLTFNWPALVGYAAVAGMIDAPAMALYAGLIFWTLAYDTIYAMQDREDDALAGVKSSARALGRNARAGVAGFYVVSAAMAAIAAMLAGGAAWFALGAAPYAAYAAWLSARLRGDGDSALFLRLFRANRDAGLILFAGLVGVGLV